MTSPTVDELIAMFGEPDDLAECSDTTNLDRADWARSAVEAFAARTRQAFGFGNNDVENALEVIGDLIGDLFHLCMTIGVQPDEIVEQAMRHFTSEVGLGYDQ